jgi:N-acetylmuramoyl-L-alanine amidase
MNRDSNSLERIYSTVLLALVIWREARGEGEAAWRAVGCSIRNRVIRPSWWGRDFVEVVTKKWQYSSMAAPGDPQLILYPKLGDSRFHEILNLAGGIIDGLIESPVPGADSYFDDSIAPPKWATPDKFVGKIGRLNFYNLDSDCEAIQRQPIATIRP